jgi:L-ribulose-5-phosphate 3-epimerase
MQLSVSSYSFNRFGLGTEGDHKPTFQTMIDTCARLGVDGIELLGLHFDSTAHEDLAALRQYAFRNGVAIVAVSAHHNFVIADAEKRQQEIDKLCRWVDVAAFLGAPAVRAFGGRWSTISNFTEFMAANGQEPPQAGYTDDDGYGWNIEAFKIAAYYAGKKGVTLMLENHWGFTGTAAGTERILRETGSPWLKVVLDTGNFNYAADQYAEMAALAPHAAMVHAKTYMGGGIWYTGDIDYRRVAQILRDVNFKGYVSLEFEGKAHPDQSIPESLSILREAFDLAPAR